MDITWETRNIRHVHLETKTKQWKMALKENLSQICWEEIIWSEYSGKTNNSNYLT